MLGRSFRIESSSKMLITRTGIKARLSSILGRIRPLILELLALEWQKVYTFELEYHWSQLANLDQILCVASLGWGKGCIMFWGRLDQNSCFHGNRKPPLTYNGENDVSTFSRLFLIRPFWKDHIWPWHIGLRWTVVALWATCSENIVFHDLKLATDDWSDKKFLLTSKLCPLGAVCPLPRGYIHVLNHEKNCIKSDFRDFLWNLQQMGIKFFFTDGMSAPAPGLYTCIKSWKFFIKLDIFLKLATNERCDKSFLLTSKLCPLGAVCSCPGAIYMYETMK